MTTIGQNSPGDAAPEEGNAKWRGEDARVAEDRSERPERGRGQRDPEHPPLGVEAERLEGDSDGEAGGCGERPPSRSARQDGVRHAVLDDLQPDEEEQQPEAERGEVLQVRVDLRDAEHLGADQDAEHDLADDRRQDDAP